MTRTASRLVGPVILATIYVLLARLGLKMDAVSGFATLVWPPTGISLAALLLFGEGLWPGVALGAFVVNLLVGGPLPVAAGIAAGNTLEAVIGARLLRLVPGFRPALGRPADVVALIGLGALLSTTVSASTGIVCLYLGGKIAPGHAGETWLAWWVGDLLGDVVVAPLLLTWASPPRPSLRPARIAEAGALLGALVALGLLIFCQPGDRPSVARQVYLIFPPLLWAALRFHQRGAITAAFLVSAIAIWGTAHGAGPFARGSLHESLLYLQTFMAVATATALILGAALDERDRAVRSRDEFLGVVSHDLKNPLATILLSAASLDRRLPEDERGPVGLIRRSAARMERLIGDLRDIAAIEAAQLAVERRPQDAGALLRDAVERAQPLAAARRQTLTVDAPEDLRVLCDRERLLQVLENLIGNAIKYTPEGGAITVTVRRERRGQASVARFTVSDNGPGIPQGELQRIFERYWRARGGKDEGSGLGLSIAKGIVEAHGGQIWAESQEGDGSRLLFTLPLPDHTLAGARRRSRS